MAKTLYYHKDCCYAYKQVSDVLVGDLNPSRMTVKHTARFGYSFVSVDNRFQPVKFAGKGISVIASCLHAVCRPPSLSNLEFYF